MGGRHASIWDVATILFLGAIAFSVLAIRLSHYRVTSRESACSTNLKQIGLAIQNYNADYIYLPSGSSGTGAGNETEPLLGNANRLSPFVGLLPFMEQQELWEQISNPYSANDQEFPTMGPVPWYDPTIYTPWSKRPSYLVCPSDRTATKFASAASYVINYGDAIVSVGASEAREMPPYVLDRTTKRGTFVRERQLRFRRDFLDGTSNTLMFAEARVGGVRVAKNVKGLALDPSLCIVASDKLDTEYWPEGRKSCWADGSLRSIGFQTILPPNSPSCTSKLGELEGVMSASSFHPGGVHVVYADGHTQFIVDSIDVGDSTAPSVAQPRTHGFAEPGSKSPYGLWGALGTRSSRDKVKKRGGADIADPQSDLSEEEIKQIQSKPLETWTSSDEKSRLQAWFLRMIGEKGLFLLTEQGQIKYVPIDHLKANDVARANKYQAVQINQKASEHSASLAGLIEHMRDALKFLNGGNELMFVLSHTNAAKDDREILAKLVSLDRGKFIYDFDQTILKLSDPCSKFSISESNGKRRLVVSPKMEFVHSGRRWKLKVGELSKNLRDEILSRFEQRESIQPTDKHKKLVDRLRAAIYYLSKRHTLAFTFDCTDIAEREWDGYAKGIASVRGELIDVLETAFWELRDSNSKFVTENETGNSVRVTGPQVNLEFKRTEKGWRLITDKSPWPRSNIIAETPNTQPVGIHNELIRQIEEMVIELSQKDTSWFVPYFIDTEADDRDVLVDNIDAAQSWLKRKLQAAASEFAKPRSKSIQIDKAGRVVVMDGDWNMDFRRIGNSWKITNTGLRFAIPPLWVGYKDESIDLKKHAAPSDQVADKHAKLVAKIESAVALLKEKKVAQFVREFTPKNTMRLNFTVNMFKSPKLQSMLVNQLRQAVRELQARNTKNVIAKKEGSVVYVWIQGNTRLLKFEIVNDHWNWIH